MTIIAASGLVSFSPAPLLVRILRKHSSAFSTCSNYHSLQKKPGRQQYLNIRNRVSASLPVISASLTNHVEPDTISIKPVSVFREISLLADLDPGTAKVAIGILGPALSAFGFLFIVRIVMSWYPKLPVNKFPYVLAYAPTEPILVQTRKVIPPLAGVDVTPVVWFGLLSFLSEILVGPQGLLVLVSQQTG